MEPAAGKKVSHLSKQLAPHKNQECFKTGGSKMTKNMPKPGTTDQRPKWEGPPENRPRGYEPAEDAPDHKKMSDTLNESKQRNPSTTKEKDNAT